MSASNLASRTLIAALLALPLAASAGDLRISSQTFLGARQVAEDTEAVTSVPLIQQLYLNATDFGGFDVVLSAWAGLDPVGGTTLRGNVAAGDVDLGYIQGQFLQKRLALRLGRQAVTTGTARFLQLDGGYASYMFNPNIGATVFGGVPVTPRFAATRGDVAAGGRMFYRAKWGTEFGASFTHIMDRGRIFRQELGIDGRTPLKFGITAFGSLLWATTEMRIAEADLGAIWHPLNALFVTARYRRTSPDLFVSRGSIFSVFSMEDRDEVGANVDWKVLDGVSVGADGYAFLTNADRYGIRGRLYGRILPAQSGGPWLGAELTGTRMLGFNDYLQLRLRASDKFFNEKLYLAGECELSWFQQPIRGQSYSTAAVATVGYQLMKGLRAQVTGIAGITPWYEQRLEAMAKVAYDLDMEFGGGEK